MNKSNRSSSDDRLSKLPDSLIFHIFWFLPIRYVVRTTKLSKRWRNLWTTSPFLNFNDYWSNDSLDSVRNLFNRALLLWRGVKLLKFKVMIQRQLSIPLVSDIDVWVRFAKEKQVEELYIELWYPNYYQTNGCDRVYADFGSLFLCSSLKVLSLKGCPFFIEDVNLKWDRLESLTIDGACLNEAEITKILCGSPKLEVFILTLAETEEDLCIRSSSLRKLSIRKNLEGLDAAYHESSDTELKIRTAKSRDTELKILTPNLEKLELLGLPYGKFSMKVSSLTHVTLGFCEVFRYRTDEFDRFLDVDEPLKQIMPTIQDVGSVTLSCWCLEALGDMNNKSLLSPMPKVKFLKLSASFSIYEQMASLLQIFPKLERLVIEDENDYDADNDDDDDPVSLEFEANLPNSYLLHLRIVEVTWAEGDKLIFSFIKILLKYASKLERMVFRVKGIMPPSCLSHSMFLASQKLLRMPRSSPTAKLIFCEY